MKSVLAQAAAHHLGEAHQGRLELLDIGGVFSEGMLVADGLGLGIGANIAIEPTSSVKPVCLAGQGEAPFPETLFEQ